MVIIANHHLTITLKKMKMTMITPPPSLAELTTRSLLAAFALVAGLVLLAGPAAAQTFRIPGNFDHFTHVMENEGRGLGDPVTSLNGFLTNQADQWTFPPAVTDLDIEALDWPGTTVLGVGGESRCAYGSGDATRLVGFHNATGKYTHGESIATACTYWGKPKCSRTVTVRGRTFTANRGSPPCPPNPQQGADNVPTGRHILTTGMFTVRIWGKVCLTGRVNTCFPAREPAPADGVDSINGIGYIATFKGGGNNCGPAIWPTPEMRAAGAPPYAAWCDFTFDIR